MTTKPPIRVSVGAVERLTGLSHHVIRAWERRHGVVKPDRTPSGMRRYSEADIVRLKLLGDAVKAGHRISIIAKLSNQEIRTLLPESSQHELSTILDAMLKAARHLNRAELERLLTREALALGPFDFCCLVVGPLLDRIGEAWPDSELCITEEHVATATIKGVLMSLFRFGHERVNGDMMLFSTLPEERHEIGALMSAVCAQDAGARVLYLGPDLPIAELIAATRRSAARVLGLSAVIPPTAAHLADLAELRRTLPRAIEIWIGGRGWSGVDVPSGVRVVATLDELRQRVLRLAKKALLQR
jgi:DNA-binding transcriptional MerR regulator